jgi:uncharacterized membrane protein
MNPALGRVLLIIGVVLLVVAFIFHVAVRVLILPHFSIFLGVIAVVVAAIGAYDMTSKSRSA